MPTEDTLEAYVLYPTPDGVRCGQVLVLNGVDTRRYYTARVMGYSFPPVGKKVRLVKDPLAGGWVVMQ